MKIIVFGANSDAQNFIRQVEVVRVFLDIEIVGVVDNDSRLHNTFLEGYEIISPLHIGNLIFDKIIVCPIFHEEIFFQLRNLGIDENKVHRLYKQEFFSKNRRNIKGSNIGEYSYFKSNTTLLSCEVGKFCHIGDNCIIGQAGHRIDLATTYPLHYHFTNAINDVSEDKTKDERRMIKPTLIGNDVYIGESVVIQGGIEIGDGSVIASRSVVTKDVEPYSVVGGIPAKILKKRFSDDIIEDLMNIRWWDFHHDVIRENIDSFTLEIEEFIRHWSKLKNE